MGVLVSIRGGSPGSLTGHPWVQVGMSGFVENGSRMVRRARRYGWRTLAIRRATRSAGRLVVLTFHGIREPGGASDVERNLTPLPVFRDQVAFLRRLPVVDPDEAALDPDCCGVLLTFDDGYRNTLIAAEVLAEAGLPWMLAVPTGVIGTTRSIWTVELSLLLLRGRAESIDLFGRSWDLRSDGARRSAFDAIRHRMKEVPASERRALSAAVEAQFADDHVTELLDAQPGLRMLDWGQLDDLARLGVRIGSHGHLHEILHDHQAADVVAEEVFGSREQIARHIGRTPSLFVYPNGRTAPASVAAVQAAGYRLAFTTQPGTALPGSSSATVPRWELPSSGARAGRLLAREFR